MRLYKYYTPESFNLICTENGLSLRFSQPSVLNDEFEFDGVITEITPKNIIDMFNISNNPQAQNEKLKFQFGGKEYQRKMIEEFTNDIKIKSKNHYNSSIGVLSLSHEKNSKSLWSYYAKDMSGFMIEIEVDEDIFKFPTLGSDVKYSTKRPPSIVSEFLLGKIVSSKDSLESLSKVMFTKHDSWVKECEFRITSLLSKVPKYGIDPKKFPVHCALLPAPTLKGVYLGARASQEFKGLVIKKLNSTYVDTQLYTSKPCNHSFDMTYIPLNRHTSDTPST